MCDSRKVCLTKKEAESFLRKNEKSRYQNRKECRTYYCVFHNAWHLTSQEQQQPVEDVRLKFFNKWKKLLKS